MSTEKPKVISSPDSHKRRASTFNSDWNTFIFTVSPGDVLLVGSNYFHVRVVKESAHAIPDSIVLGGYWFDSENKHWHPRPSTYHCHKVRVPHVPVRLSKKEIKKCGLEVLI